MSGKLSILVVDDDQKIAETLKDILILTGHDVDTAFSGEEAVEKIKKGSFNFLLTDIRMPEMGGVDLCRTVKQIQPDIPVVMMTAYAHDRRVKEGLDEGVVEVLQKPLDIDNLRKLITTLSKGKNHGQ